VPTPAKKPLKKMIEIVNAKLVVTIRAEFDIAQAPDDGDSIGQSIEDALENLRGYGSADVIERRLFGTPKPKGS
jgi:hypothetical protein